MCRKFFKFILRFSVVSIIFSLVHSSQFHKSSHKNFALLSNFACSVVQDELEQHPEMRTVALFELESNFPSTFCRDILQCLPVDVAKVVLNPHDPYVNTTFNLPKESMILFIADKIDIDDVSAAQPPM